MSLIPLALQFYQDKCASDRKRRGREEKGERNGA